MSKLANPLHEKEARLLIANNYNKTKTYLQTHPDANYNSANSNANHYMVKNGIETRAVELAEAEEATKLATLIGSFKDDLTATKPVLTKNGVEYTRDNAIVLDAKKFLIQKVHQVGNEQTVQDNRSVNISVTNENTSQLGDTLDKLEQLTNRLDKSTRVFNKMKAQAPEAEQVIDVNVHTPTVSESDV